MSHTEDANNKLEIKKIISVLGQKVIICGSPVMVQVLRQAELLSAGNKPVYIHGPTGSGKSLIAAYIHKQSRRTGDFVDHTLSGLPEQLIHSTLFGHEKGAFTGATEMKKGCFEIADNGTIFLDEVADFNPQLQANLLKVLETGEFYRLGSNEPRKTNVRVVSASNKDLLHEVRQGRFREDLHFRLEFGRVEVPALSERVEDIALLANHFLKQETWQDYGPLAFSSEVIRLLEDHHWPGNVRELQRAVHLSALSCQHDRKKVVHASHLPDQFKRLSIRMAHAESYHPAPYDGGWEDGYGERFADALVDSLAARVHDVYCAKRQAEGWRWGPVHNGTRKRNPYLLPWDELARMGMEQDDGHDLCEDDRLMVKACLKELLTNQEWRWLAGSVPTGLTCDQDGSPQRHDLSNHHQEWDRVDALLRVLTQMMDLPPPVQQRPEAAGKPKAEKLHEDVPGPEHESQPVPLEMLRGMIARETWESGSLAEILAPLQGMLADLERLLVEERLQRLGGHRENTAKSLGKSRSWLQNILRERMHPREIDSKTEPA